MIAPKTALSLVSALVLLSSAATASLAQRRVQPPRFGVLSVDEAFTPGQLETVVVELRFEESGELRDARVLEGREDLRRRAVQVALADEFDADAERIEVEVRFSSPEDAGMYPLLYVEPTVTPIIRSARASGDVMLEAIVDPQGRVRDVSASDGHPMLQRAAMAAVRQWRFEPYILNGAPVSVVTPILIRFQYEDD
jgi:TonB family protein